MSYTSYSRLRKLIQAAGRGLQTCNYNAIALLFQNLATIGQLCGVLPCRL